MQAALESSIDQTYSQEDIQKLAQLYAILIRIDQKNKAKERLKNEQ